MFGRKKSSQTERQAQILQSQVEFRRLHDRFEYMLEHEIREANRQRDAGVQRPSNYDRIKVIYQLLKVTDSAYQEARSISDTDQLTRVTNDLAGALRKLNALSAESEQLNAGSVRREVRRMERGEEQRQEDTRTAGDVLGQTRAAESEVPFELMLERMLADQKSEAADKGGTGCLASDDELDELNRKLNEMIDSL